MGLFRQRISISACTVMMLACAARAQTTQPAAVPAKPAATWSEVVAQLAEALVDGNADETVMRLIPDDALIRRFDRADYDDRLALRDATAGLSVIATHGYLGVPNSIASDLATDFRSSSRVPDELKDQMVPADESAAKRANVTAGQWVTSSLEPDKAQPIGIIVLLRRDALSPGASESFSLVFVLVKSEPAVAHQFHITNVVWGDTHHIVRQ